MPGSQNRAPPGVLPPPAAAEDAGRSPGQVSHAGEPSTSGRRMDHRWQLSRPAAAQTGDKSPSWPRGTGQKAAVAEDKSIQHPKIQQSWPGSKPSRLQGGRVACPQCGYLKVRAPEQEPCPICVRRNTSRVHQFGAISEESKGRHPPSPLTSLNPRFCQNPAGAI